MKLSHSVTLDGLLRVLRAKVHDLADTREASYRQRRAARKLAPRNTKRARDGQAKP